MEVLFQHDMVAEEPRELVDYLDGPNHWVLFSHVGAGNHSQKGAPTPTMTISDIFNRLVMMANAELVVLSFQDDMRYISKVCTPVAPAAHAATRALEIRTAWQCSAVRHGITQFLWQ